MQLQINRWVRVIMAKALIFNGFKWIRFWEQRRNHFCVCMCCAKDFITICFSFCCLHFSLSLSEISCFVVAFVAIYDTHKCTLKHFNCSPFNFGYGKSWCLHSDLDLSAFVSSKVKSIAKSFVFAFISFSNVNHFYSILFYFSISKVHEFSPGYVLRPSMLSAFGSLNSAAIFRYQFCLRQISVKFKTKTKL